MTESKVAASIRKALEEMDAADEMRQEAKREAEKKRQEIKNEAQKKRRESDKKKREADEKVSKELGNIFRSVVAEEGDFAEYKNRSVADLWNAIFCTESEGEVPSDSPGTESSEPHGTDNGSEGGYSNDAYQSQGWD